MNPHRERGTGRGTPESYRAISSMEEGPVLKVVSAPKNPEKDISGDAPPKDTKDIPLNAAGVHAGPAIGNPKEADPLIEELSEHPDNVLGAIHDVLDKASSPESEIKLPKNFFEKALADAKGETYNIVKRGLDLVRATRYENKDIEIVKDKGVPEIDYKLLEKIKLVDPNNEKLLAEIKRLNNFEAKEYDIDNLRRKIDSYADIIYLKISDKPESEKQKGYKERVREIMGHEVREIFRQNKDVGQALEVAIYLPIAVHKGLVKIVDRKEGNAQEKGKFMYRSGPTPETAARKPSHEISTEERITAFEDEIASDFGEGERRYVRQWVDIYPAEFRKAIDKREKNGKKVTEKEIPAIRLSFINQIAKWGSGRGMAPEKAELLEKYLRLKLPVGLPVEKADGTVEDSEKTKETNFTTEQSPELVSLIKNIGKIRDQIDQSALNEIVEEIIREDLIPQGIFAEDDFQRARDHVIKWVQKFNDKK